MKHYIIPREFFFKIKSKYIDGRAFWRKIEDNKIEIKTPYISLQNLLENHKIEQNEK